eukprot:2025526-Pyramimonas_sp.AAC.1
MSNQTSSGEMTVATADSGDWGTSGFMEFVTGDTTAGNSGAMTFTTGDALQGHGGTITFTAGKASRGVKETGSAGGDMEFYAGETTDAGFAGGVARITGGTGSNTSSDGGGMGGNLYMTAGAGYGGNNLTDVGGTGYIDGGYSENSYGGDMIIYSGTSGATSSGE